MSAADMFSAANRELNRKNERAKHAAVEAASKAEKESEMKAAEEKARADAQAEAARMEAEQQHVKALPNFQAQESEVKEPELANATQNTTENATQNVTTETPAPKAAPVAKKVSPPQDPDDSADARVRQEEEKFPTDWIKNDVKFNVDKPTSTREDSVAEAVQKQMKWKTSTEGWFLQTKTFTLRPWGTPA
jgi:hypothetical protein